MEVTTIVLIDVKQDKGKQQSVADTVPHSATHRHRTAN